MPNERRDNLWLKSLLCESAVQRSDSNKCFLCDNVATVTKCYQWRQPQLRQGEIDKSAY